MWQVGEQDWECLKRVGADCTADQKKQLRKIIDKGEITREDVDKIFDLLPKNANFFEFAQQLCLSPRSHEGPKPTAEFLALTQKLRQKQANNEYNKMITSVDSAQNYGHVNLMQDFGKEMKEVNRQLIAIVNALITVAGAFAFGYYGINLAYPSLNLNFETRLIMGMCAGTIVFFADMYFIIKSMDAPTPQKQTKAGEETFALNTREIAMAAATPRTDETEQQSSRKKKPTPKQEKKSEPTKKSPKADLPKSAKKSENKVEPVADSPKPNEKVDIPAEPEETIIKDVPSDEPQSTVTHRPKTGRRRATKID